MTIRLKLLLSMALLGASLLCVGLVGYYALAESSEKTKTIVLDRVTPLAQLKLIADAYAVNMVDTAHKIRSGAISWEEGSAAIADAASVIDESWSAYAATSVTAEEADISKSVQAAMAQAQPAIDDLVRIVADVDQARLDTYVEEILYPTIDPIGTPISHLIDLQTRVAAEEYAAAESLRSASTLMMTAIAAVAAAILSVSIWFVVRGVIAPINAMRDAMLRLSSGDTQVAIPGVGRADEIGGMAAAVQVFKKNAVERASLEEAQRREQAAKEVRSAVVDKLIADFNTDVSQILRTVASASSELEATAGSLSAVAERGALNATTVAAAAAQATANVQTVAAASEELAVSVGEIAAQVDKSLDVTKRALDAAAATDQTVQGLLSTAERIGNVVKLISDVADQTNLLALNATIEAARAGEAGRGFAVVASEVKTLAEQTSRATNEIASQIQEIQAVTEKAAGAIRTVGETIREIGSTSTAIASAVEEQGAATREIARNVNQAAVGTQQVSTNVADVTHGVTQTGAGASQVLSSAGELAQQSEALKMKVEQFFNDIRAA
ncbi:MAG TPA: methyl-accepting chemotaxis protein [Methylomirabilota bacterium]|nr:methyl-accepting chemotaxis protein [Methylomirabilota bacterium]